jgi:hypothetical protein
MKFTKTRQIIDLDTIYSIIATILDCLEVIHPTCKGKLAHDLKYLTESKYSFSLELKTKVCVEKN